MSWEEFPGYNVEELHRQVLEMVRSLHERPNVKHVDVDELRKMAEPHGTQTKYGNYVFTTCVRNRSAALTVYIGGPDVMRPRDMTEKQKDIVMNAPQTVEKLHRYLEKVPIVCTQRVMCDSDELSFLCTLYLTVHRKDCVRLGYMWSLLLFGLDKKRPNNQEMYLVHVPEWLEKDRQILVFPEIGVTYVLGSDYLGETKKGFLRMAMWFAKQKGILGLHAGAKVIRARDRRGVVKRYSMLLFGLSGTGKTTHTCHDHGLTQEGEGIEIVQDDVIFLRIDGAGFGPENGFFLKTDIDPSLQPLIWKAAIKPTSVLENVLVDYQGNCHFLDETLTGNGRGVFLRESIDPEHLHPSVNLPPLSELDGMVVIFITRRNTVVPIMSKLTPEQAAAAFMLGESIETTASDPARAGESVRVVGTNPFIIGDPVEEGLWFYEFLKRHGDKVRCFLLNTGGVGEILRKEGRRVVVEQKVVRVEIPETASIIRGVLRDNIEWVEEPYFGTLVPAKVDGVDMSKFDLSKYYTEEQIQNYVRQLKRERAEYFAKKYSEFLKHISMDEKLARFIGLDEFPMSA